MAEEFSQNDLEAFLDEALPPEEMARIEQQLRNSPQLIKRLAHATGRRDSGVHTLGEIWRRHRISCPSREQLGSYALKALGDEPADYIRFHLEVIGCRYCGASLADLQTQQTDEAVESATRRRRYFESSAGHLPKKGRSGDS